MWYLNIDKPRAISTPNTLAGVHAYQELGSVVFGQFKEVWFSAPAQEGG